MIFAPMFSIFILLTSGYLAKKTKVLAQNQSIIFVDFVLCFALPAMIFDRIYHVEIDINLINVILTGICSSLIAMGIAVGVGILLKFKKPTLVSLALLSMFGNTLFVGIPVVQGFFGDEAINEVIFYDQLATGIPISILGPLILSLAAPAKVSLVQNTIKVLKFPPFVALILRLICRNFELPDIIFPPLKMFASSVVPVALFAVGIGLGFNSVKSAWKSTSVVLVAKMVLAPAIFIGIAFVFGVSLDDKWLIGLVECAMPPMVLASAMILKANLDTNLAISSVALGIVATFITIPSILLILN
ncbi:putative membrane protein, predicted permease [Campylobacter iguaniorum]|uniref:AEC family transporter n=1 Tax=Campylobacter iguaniorum TaxID=1244531 RepID=UPI0007C9302B|nr:AEC family transporter [Campylobacter iguaniorum]ANE35810.1 putative membrane protein, predicted permease [Campylobacter iguaniorum]